MRWLIQRWSLCMIRNSFENLFWFFMNYKFFNDHERSSLIGKRSRVISMNEIFLADEVEKWRAYVHFQFSTNWSLDV